MTRHPDLERKPALLEQIVDYLLDKPLASLSFRTLAKALDVSTFTLVYHFGSRAELLRDIVGAISSREVEMKGSFLQSEGTVDSYFQGLDTFWEWVVDPGHRQLQRLEFEAAMMEAHDPLSHTFTRDLFARWQRNGKSQLMILGLSEENAEIESRLVVDTLFGLQYDLVINRDVDRAGDAFARFVSQGRNRIEALLAEA